jgi:MATE family multidrug resistance protein
MPTSRSDLRAEFAPMLRMAVPLALAELGWMAMGLEDTIMAGRLGAAALGAGSLGAMVFYPIAIGGLGFLLGMDTLVAQAHGARDAADCRRTLVNGVWLGMALAPPFALAILSLIPLLRVTGTNPNVMVLFDPFLKALAWGLPPLFLYAALRRYLQAIDVVKPVTFALVSANVVNVVGNWVLMYGHWGAPRMGLEGCGWSTTIARCYMAAVLLATIVWHERRTGSLLLSISWRPSLDRIRRLAALGMPAALQFLFEGAVFSLVSVFAAHLDEASLAAHSIAINVVSTTYMVPLGISSAAAVRVGQACGAGDRRGAAARGWAAILLGALFMGGAGVALGIVPGWIVRVYTGDAAVISTGTLLLRIAALFQLFDGLQTVSTGALRGLGDTRTPMLVHLAGYWAIGLPLAYVLCFKYRWGVAGIWVGLSAALILIGSALVAVWRSRAARCITSETG